MPIFLGSLLQQSYNFVDALIIGRYVGPDGLAAIDATYNYTKLLINVFLSIALGGSILISQYLGAKNTKKVEQVVHVLFMFAFIGGGLITLAGIGLAPFFSNLMNVPLDIFDMCVNYLRIYFLGTVFSFLFNIASGILRAVGDSKRPFIYLMISSILNIALDFLFVAKLNMGVSGAAIATVISQGLACIIIMAHLRSRKDNVQFNTSKLRFDRKVFKEIMKVGLPLGGQTSLYVISNMMVQRGINSFGIIGIAAWSICGKMDFIIWLCIDAIGVTTTTFVAQNFGALNKSRMERSVKYSFVMLTLVIGVFSALLFIFVPNIASWFTTDQTVIRQTTEMMRIIAPLYVLPGISQIISGAIKGTGETLKPMIIAFIGTAVVRVLWIVIALPMNQNALMAVTSYPVSWLITVIIFIVMGQKFRKDDQNKYIEYETV